jgi:hypothetical protein
VYIYFDVLGIFSAKVLQISCYVLLSGKLICPGDNGLCAKAKRGTLMIVTDFAAYFSENEERFKELVKGISVDGYVTDESFGVSRCLLESVSHRNFETVFERHFPGQPLEMQVASTAFRRYLGEYVYVIYDESIFLARTQIESKLKLDGVLGIDPEDYAI